MMKIKKGINDKFYRKFAEINVCRFNRITDLSGRYTRKHKCRWQDKISYIVEKEGVRGR
jgi:hypothetical protein